MFNKNYVKKILIILFFFIIALLIYFKFIKKDKIEVFQEQNTEETYNSNIIKNVEYSTKDKDGNEYLITAEEGEIDLSNSDVIFLKKVSALINLIDSNEVTIFSDFGKYNLENFNTIFSKNVIINYLDNKITGEYLDFSLERNSMIISKNVNYKNLESLMRADVLEIDIKSKDAKIFMYEDKNKVEVFNKY